MARLAPAVLILGPLDEPPRQEARSAFQSGSFSSSFRSLEQLRRNRISWPFFIPQHRLNPPALSVVVQRKNIHAACYHFTRGLHSSLITAQHARHISESLDLSAQLNFRESLLQEEIFTFVQVFLIIRSSHLHFAGFIFGHRYIPHAWRKQRPVAPPLPRHAHTARNSLVARLHNSFNCAHVFRPCCNRRHLHLPHLALLLHCVSSAQSTGQQSTK